MKAAVLREYGQPLSIEDLDLLPPGPGEVRVRFAASGVCASDMTRIQGKRASSLPIVLGHEASGYVEELGPGVTGLAPGDRVVMSFVYDCGECFYCRAGQPNLCEVGLDMLRLGHMPDGTTRLRRGDEVIHHMVVSSFAEYGVVPARCAIRIPDSMPMDAAALIGCAVLTGTGAVFNTGKVRPGESVMVVGTGGVGLNIIQGAAIAGAGKIIAVDINPDKLDIARQFGATHTIDAGKTDPVTAARELTGGRGVDYALEALGHTKTVEQCFAAVRKGGKAIVVGVGEAGTCCELDILTMALQEKSVAGCFYGSTRPRPDVERLAQFYEDGRLKLDELITRDYRLDQVNAAFDDLRSGVLARGLIRYE